MAVRLDGRDEQSDNELGDAGRDLENTERKPEKNKGKQKKVEVTGKRRRLSKTVTSVPEEDMDYVMLGVQLGKSWIPKLFAENLLDLDDEAPPYETAECSDVRLTATINKPVARSVEKPVSYREKDKRETAVVVDGESGKEVKPVADGEKRETAAVTESKPLAVSPRSNGRGGGKRKRREVDEFIHPETQGQEVPQISEETLATGGKRLMNIFKLENMVNQLVEQQTAFREELQTAFREELRTTVEELHKEQTAWRNQLEDRLYVADMFDNGKLLFTCDIVHNLLVKLSYSLQTVIAKKLQSSQLQLAQLQLVFEETNLAQVCYGRVLKRFLKLQGVDHDKYIDGLLICKQQQQQQQQSVDAQQQQQSDEAQQQQLEQAVEADQAQENGDEENEEMEEGGVEGTQQLHEAEEEDEEAKARKKEEKERKQILEVLCSSLHTSEEQVAKELGVDITELGITAAVYVLCLKPIRNVEAHPNQLHPPPSWRYRPSDDNPAPPWLTPPWLINVCLSPAPTSFESSATPREEFKNLQMVDFVMANYKNILAGYVDNMSDGVLITIMLLVREKICNTLADTFRSSLWRHGTVPTCFLPIIESSVSGGNKKAKRRGKKEGWLLWPKKRMDLQVLLPKRVGDWEYVEGNKLEKPFSDWPLREMLGI